MLSVAYTPINLSAMLYGRYATAQYVAEYKQIIAEAIEAHCLALGHASVLGLIPVIEGVGRKVLDSRGLQANGIRDVFIVLADHCKNEVTTRDIGAIEELHDMLDAFREFAVNYLYVRSDAYPLDDNTNRHGPAHGALTDGDYGRPISFFKIIGCLDMLCLITALWSGDSWFAPTPTAAATDHAAHLVKLIIQAKARPPI